MACEFNDEKLISEFWKNQRTYIVDEDETYAYIGYTEISSASLSYGNLVISKHLLYFFAYNSTTIFDYTFIQKYNFNDIVLNGFIYDHKALRYFSLRVLK